MELRVLRYFLAVAREGTIVGASKTLGVTQPTLSRQLLDLEDELGQRLFERSNRSISLTPAGMLFRQRAEEIVELVGMTEADFKSLRSGTVLGDVTIGGGESSAMRLIADVIEELSGRHPSMRFHLYSGNAEDVKERLDKGILDFGVLIEPVDVSRYERLPLPAKDVWGLVMRRDSPLAGKRVIRREDLLEVPLICSRMHYRQDASSAAYAQWFGADRERLKVVATYNLIYNASLLVASGVGYALALDRLLNISSHSELCFRPLEPRLEVRLALVWKRERLRSQAAEAFLNQMKQRFA